MGGVHYIFVKLKKLRAKILDLKFYSLNSLHLLLRRESTTCSDPPHTRQGIKSRSKNYSSRKSVLRPDWKSQPAVVGHLLSAIFAGPRNRW